MKFHTAKKHKVITLFSNKATATTAVLNTLSDVIPVSNAGSGYGNSIQSYPPTVNFNGGTGGGAVAVANMVNGGVASITLVNGGSYTGAPTISFTPNSAVKASVITEYDGILVSPTIVSGGSGYIGTIVCTIQAPPLGSTRSQTSVTATATAVVTSGVVTSVTITNGSTNYTGDVAITITGDPNTAGTLSAATLASQNGEIKFALITNNGSGYANGATAIITPRGGGQGASASVVVSGGVVSAINITSGGTGYDQGATIVIIPTPTVPAVVMATVGERVKQVQIDKAGYYSTVPTTVTFSAPGTAGGVTATGVVASANNGVTGVTLTNAGSGYLTAPTITFSGGVEGGSGAVATCSLSAPRTYEYVFEIPPQELSENAKISLIYLASQNSAANTVYTVRMKEINTHNSWDNAYGWPVINSQQSLNMIQ